MFEQLPTNPHISFSFPLKLIAAGAAGLILALGLCGIDHHFYPNAEFGGSILAFLGALLILLSGIAIAVGLLIFIVKAITEFFSS